MGDGAPAPYTDAFYRAQRDGSRRSAEVIVPIVIELVQPRSVVDVGCGVGTWLAVFAKHGVTDILGIDGEHVDRRLLEIPGASFVSADLREPLAGGAATSGLFKPLCREFDLVVSLEVGEHLPSACADTLVDSLVGLGAVVLFSAAIPFQGGPGHVNEQWPGYWAARFETHGYVTIDSIRPRVWDRDDIEWWYAQNVLVYARRDRVACDAALAHAHAATSRGRLDLVHPRKHLEAVEWTALVRNVRADLRVAVPRGAPVILVDEDQLRPDVAGPMPLVPFPEQDGSYWGLPADDASALAELDRLRSRGACFLAVARPAFWWLEHYVGFDREVRRRFPCVLQNDRVVVFDLRGS